MKIITAHIKKACAEKRIIMEKIKKNVSNIKIKDPGSAITHFIAMLMALFAATPLIIKALSAPDTIHVISLSIDRKSTRLNSSHDRQSRMPSSA